MYREIEDPALVLLIPLTPEEWRKVEYLDDTLSDGAWEVRTLQHDDAIRTVRTDSAFAINLEYVVRALFDALDTVTQAQADEYAAQADDFETCEDRDYACCEGLADQAPQNCVTHHPAE